MLRAAALAHIPCVHMQVRLNAERIKYWLSVGAQPSERVNKLLGMAKIVPTPPQRRPTIRHIPKAERKDAKGFATSAVISAQNELVGMPGGGFFSPIVVPKAIPLPW